MGEPPEPPGSQYPTQQHALRTTDRHSNPALPLSGSSLPFTADCGPIWPTAAWSHVRPGSNLQEHQPRPLTLVGIGAAPMEPSVRSNKAADSY